MDLQRNSQEYAHITFSAQPTNGDVVEASVNLIDWYPVTIGGDGVGLVLLRGPAAIATEGVLVTNDREELWIRITSTPEVIVRSAGWIVLY